MKYKTKKIPILAYIQYNSWITTQCTVLHIKRGSERSYSQRLSHSCRKQSRVCTDEPSQLLVMRSQERPRVWVPLPQVTEHCVHSDHGDQPAPS